MTPMNPRHGTRTDYNRGCRCEQCKYANAEYAKVQRARLAKREVPPEVHGTVGGYTNWLCRCGRCSTAHTEYEHILQANRVARGLAADDPRHGTKHAYTAWGCRCQPCKEAASAAWAARKLRQDGAA